MVMIPIFHFSQWYLFPTFSLHLKVVQVVPGLLKLLYPSVNSILIFFPYLLILPMIIPLRRIATQKGWWQLVGVQMDFMYFSIVINLSFLSSLIIARGNLLMD